MNFTIKTKILKKYLKHLGPAIPPIAHRPELYGVAIDVYDNRVVFQIRNDFLDFKVEETDLNVLKIISPGKILVKAKMLNEIVQKIESEDIEFITIDKNILVIKSQDSEYELNLLNSDKYERAIFKYDQGLEMKIDSFNFRNLIQKVIVAGNEKSSRRILQGVNLIYHNGILNAFATDNVRVSFAKTRAKAAKNFEKIIPIKTLKELVKIFDEKHELTLTFFNQKLIIQSQNAIVQTNLIEGKFPNLLAVFPQKFKFKLLTQKGELINLIDRTTILNPNKASTSLLVKLIINNGELNFESRELEIGYASVNTKNFTFEGEKIFQISFSPKYIIEALKSIDNEMVEIKFNSSQEPFVINGQNDDNFKSLILPFRT